METKHLGKPSALPASPDEAVLDYVPNPRPGALYLVRFAAPEFTTLCPVTGQPDFAHLVIDYAPGETIVESKSLKMFLGSFPQLALPCARFFDYEYVLLTVSPCSAMSALAEPRTGGGSA